MVWMLINRLKQIHFSPRVFVLAPTSLIWDVMGFFIQGQISIVHPYIMEQKRGLIAIYCPCNFPRWMRSLSQKRSRQSLVPTLEMWIKLKFFLWCSMINLSKIWTSSHSVSWSGQCRLALNYCAGNCVEEVHFNLRQEVKAILVKGLVIYVKIQRVNKGRS